MNRRIPNGTYGGVRGRRRQPSPARLFWMFLLHFYYNQKKIDFYCSIYGRKTDEALLIMSSSLWDDPWGSFSERVYIISSYCSMSTKKSNGSFGMIGCKSCGTDLKWPGYSHFISYLVMLPVIVILVIYRIPILILLLVLGYIIVGIILLLFVPLTKFNYTKYQK